MRKKKLTMKATKMVRKMLKNNMPKIEISLIGCDAETTFETIVSEEEMVTLKEIAKLSVKNSPYQCHPIMKLTRKEK